MKKKQKNIIIENQYIINYNNKKDITVTYSVINKINYSEIKYSSYLNKKNNNIITFIDF